ncbi:hypothetical protein LMG24076_02430 [Trinickia soli]|uniref:Phasin n=2 Tax=Trinickia soli TaxID=380675 RepID=A0A2N7W9L8_9BURK|nr:phasin family protein [Paraburkholderia sp. T12-10]PMS26097.1 phasin [Trinickia soli]CAB3680982.1 hypothetical protein LMG24076_02430 [Trinickia soli]
MNTTVFEQSAEFGLRTLPAFFGLQSAGFERFQKLTELNLAAFKAMLAEGQAAFSALPSGLPASVGAVDQSQQFIEHAQSYGEQVRQIESRYMEAVTQAGENVHRQCNAIRDQWSANFGQAAPFGSDAAYTAMQSSVRALMESSGMMQETLKRAAGNTVPNNA